MTKIENKLIHGSAILPKTFTGRALNYFSQGLPVNKREMKFW